MNDAPTPPARPRAGQIEEARKLDGLSLLAGSAMWPKVSAMQRLGLIRLRWTEGKRAELIFVDPDRQVSANG